MSETEDSNVANNDPAKLLRELTSSATLLTEIVNSGEHDSSRSSLPRTLHADARATSRNRKEEASSSKTAAHLSRQHENDDNVMTDTSVEEGRSKARPSGTAAKTSAKQQHPVSPRYESEQEQDEQEEEPSVTKKQKRVKSPPKKFRDPAPKVVVNMTTAPPPVLKQQKLQMKTSSSKPIIERNDDEHVPTTAVETPERSAKRTNSQDSSHVRKKQASLPPPVDESNGNDEEDDSPADTTMSRSSKMSAAELKKWCNDRNKKPVDPVVIVPQKNKNPKPSASSPVARKPTSSKTSPDHATASTKRVKKAKAAESEVVNCTCGESQFRSIEQLENRVKPNLSRSLSSRYNQFLKSLAVYRQMLHDHELVKDIKFVNEQTLEQCA